MSEIDKVIVKLEYIAEKINSIHNHIEKINVRVTKLEIWKGWTTGGLTILGIFVGGAISYLIAVS